MKKGAGLIPVRLKLILKMDGLVRRCFRFLASTMKNAAVAYASRR
jgi:hypothetical protein